MTTLVPSPEQKGILDLGLESIRIRAGAGTGKTTTVAMVIANLIENHGVQPEQVLGITFTNKAAAELASKVREMLPSSVEWGRQVEVHTYHGFAAQVLSEFGALAGVNSRVNIITPTFARQVMRDSFRHSSFSHVDITQTRSLDRIRNLGDRLGDHLLTPNDLVTASPDDPDEVWAARLEMAATLGSYTAEKRRLGVVDYADLVTLSTRVVATNPELATLVRERYKVVVLDEYQDTNPAQRVLLTTIFGAGFPVIAVGDEDQTIYEWRGASAENFESFAGHFGGQVHERELTLNRRSTQNILDVANDVRRVANPSADKLVAFDPSTTGEITTRWTTDAIAEADWIASRFEELHDSGERWKDMAVLFRKNRDFAAVIDAMARRDIPVEVANVGGLFSVPEVADLRAWLTVLERPEDSAALSQVLFGSRYRLGIADLAPLTRWVSSYDTSVDDSEEPAPVTLLEAIEAAAEVPGLRPEARRRLTRFFDVYRKTITETQGRSLAEVCRTILDNTGAWHDMEALPPNQRLTARLNIYRLLDLAEDWSPLQGRPSLGAFLDYIDAMEDEPTEELDSAHLSGEDAVTLVTIHRAKGLEWDTVAIPAVTRGSFPGTSSQFPDPARFAEHLPADLRIDTALADMPQDSKDRRSYLKERHENQEWRVAYVAVTRAKRRLLVSGAYWYGLPEPTKTPKEPSRLLELVRGHPAAVDAGTDELTTRPDYLRATHRGTNPDPLFKDGWEGALRMATDDPTAMRTIAVERGLGAEFEEAMTEATQRLFELAEPASEDPETDDLVVSVTGLVTYAQCPKRFCWTNVDPLPRRPSAAAARGTEVHRNIELHQRGQIPFDELSHDLYDVTPSSEGGPGAYQTYLDSRFADERAALIEVPFSFEVEERARVRGRIDAVYMEGTRWEVVDFKSGRPKDDPAQLVQLQAYAIAIKEVDFGFPRPEEMEVTFAYLGDGLAEVGYAATEEWVDEARSTIQRLTTAIREEVFTEQPGMWCSGCDFLRFCEPGQELVAAREPSPD